MKKLTWDELNARLATASTNSEVNRIRKMMDKLERVADKEAHEMLEQDVRNGKLCKDDSGHYF